jgi:hypothetical protein
VLRLACSHYHVPGVHWSAEEAIRRVAALRRLPGVFAVTLNGTCGTLSVSYDRHRLSAGELRAHWGRSEKVARPGEHAAAALASLRWMPLLIEGMSVLISRLRT